MVSCTRARGARFHILRQISLWTFLGLQLKKRLSRSLLQYTLPRPDKSSGWVRLDCEHKVSCTWARGSELPHSEANNNEDFIMASSRCCGQWNAEDPVPVNKQKTPIPTVSSHKALRPGREMIELCCFVVQWYNCVVTWYSPPNIQRGVSSRLADYRSAPATDSLRDVRWTVSRNYTIFLSCYVKNTHFN